MIGDGIGEGNNWRFGITLWLVSSDPILYRGIAYCLLSKVFFFLIN